MTYMDEGKVDTLSLGSEWLMLSTESVDKCVEY